MRMKRISTISSLAIAFTILIFSNANAQIAGWYFKYQDGGGAWQNRTGDETSATAYDYSSDLAYAPVITRGSGFSITTANTRTFNSIVNITPVDGAVGITQTEAENNSIYYQVVLQAGTGKTLSLGRIKFRYRRGTANASNQVLWKYYVGNAADNPTQNNFTAIGTALNLPTVITDGVSSSVEGLNFITDLQGVDDTKKIVIRAYFIGSKTTDASSAIAFGKSSNNNNVSEYGALEIIDTYTVLPVTLTSFTVKPSKSTVQLNWTTASEQNNSHFEILRSANGEPNVVIGRVNGNGTTSTENRYNFTDYSPLASAYYQLRQVDYNGDSQKSEVVFVSVNLNQNTLVAGAGNGKLVASYQSDVSTSANFSVVDLNGKVIIKKSVLLEKGANQIEVPLSLNKGLYLAKLTEINGKTQSTKFIYQ